MVSFVRDLGDMNPFKKPTKIPSTDINQCCLSVIVTGDGMFKYGEGVYILQAETRFKHPHYKNFENGMEIFFDSREYNIGKPLSSDNNRIHFRSATVMEDIYQILGRTPCAEDLSLWGFRKTDDEPWRFDKNVEVYCHKLALPPAMLELQNDDGQVDKHVAALDELSKDPNFAKLGKSGHFKQEIFKAVTRGIATGEAKNKFKELGFDDSSSFEEALQEQKKKHERRKAKLTFSRHPKLSRTSPHMGLFVVDSFGQANQRLAQGEEELARSAGEKVEWFYVDKEGDPVFSLGEGTHWEGKTPQQLGYNVEPIIETHALAQAYAYREAGLQPTFFDDGGRKPNEDTIDAINGIYYDERGRRINSPAEFLSTARRSGARMYDSLGNEVNMAAVKTRGSFSKLRKNWIGGDKPQRCILSNRDRGSKCLVCRV